MSTPTPSRPRGTDVDQEPAPARHAWALVARREVLVKLTDKTFLLSTLGMLVVVVVVLGLQASLANRTQGYTVAATPQTAEMARAVAATAPEIDDLVEVDVLSATDPQRARAAVRSGDADVWLAPTPDGFRLVGLREVDPGLRTVVDQSVQQVVLAGNARERGVTLEQLQRGAEVSTSQLEGDATRSRLAGALGFGMAFAFYLAALVFGIGLAQSVVEEKQSRLVEIIVTAIPVRQLLAGKIIGSTALALGQMLLLAVVSVVGLSFTSFADALPAVSLGIGWFLLFFVVGFVLVATLYAVAGALASRTEDVQATSLPATATVFAIFFGSAFLSGTGEVVGSFVPPISALLMPIRVVSGEAAWWEPLVAMALLLVAAALVLGVASRIYRRSLLQTSGRLSVREAWKVDT